MSGKRKVWKYERRMRIKEVKKRRRRRRRTLREKSEEHTNCACRMEH
jgi:hypothetical protein